MRLGSAAARAASLPALALAIGVTALGWAVLVCAVGTATLLALEVGHAGAFARECGALAWAAPVFYALLGIAVGVKVGLVRGIGRALVRSACAGGMIHHAAERVLDKAEELAARGVSAKRDEPVPLARFEAAVKQAVLEVSGADATSMREPERRALPRTERAAFERIERLLLARARAEASDGKLSLAGLRARVLAEIGGRVTTGVRRWVARSTFGLVGVYLVAGVVAPFVVELALG